jgi:hypothetical protein
MMKSKRHASSRRLNYEAVLCVLPWLYGAALLGGLLVLFLPDRPVTHSFHFNRVWAYQFAEQFGSGQLYPRWLAQSFGGLGSPSFVFYPPLAFYASLPFAFFGATVSQSLNGSMALATLVLGIGVYFAVKQRAGSGHRAAASIAFIAAAMGMTSPYLLENIFVRGSLGEAWAIAFIPWLMYGIYETLRELRHWWMVSLAFAGIAFSHPAILLMITFCLPFIALTLKWRVGASWHVLSALLGAFCIGGLLASVYLLPAFFDRDWLIMNEFMFDGVLNPLNRFLWALDGSVHLTEHPYDRHLLPALLLTVLVLGLGAYWCVVSRGIFRHDAYGLVLLAVVVFMVSGFSHWIYRAVPLLQSIQFSFRWLAVGTGVIPVIWGRVLMDSNGARTGPVTKAILIGLLCFSAAASLLTYSRINWGNAEAVREIVRTRSARPEAVQVDSFLTDVDRWFEERPPFPNEIDKTQPLLLSDVLHVTVSQQLFFDDAPEYLPKTARLERLTHVNLPLVEWITGEGRISVMAWHYGKREVDIVTERPGEIALRGFYWPGWEARLNGQPVQVRPGIDGRQIVRVPIGSSRLVVEYVGSQSERNGAQISAALLALFAGYFLFRVARSRNRGALVIARRSRSFLKQ